MVDEVGYIPFEAEAVNLFFQLVSSCYERACVVIVTSNKQFGKRTGSRERVQGGYLTRPGSSDARASVQAIVVDVVREVADESGVVHAKGDCGGLGIKVGDELGDSRLPAGRDGRVGVGDCSCQIAGVGRHVPAVRVLPVTITWGLNVRRACRWARQVSSASQQTGSRED